MKSEKLFVSLHRKWEKNNLKQQPQTTAPDPSKGTASPDPSKGGENSHKNPVNN